MGLPAPQQYASPSESLAHVAAQPVVTEVMVLPDRAPEVMTAIGVAELAVGAPVPNCP
jgi:hypothetical protein